jgi:hypothetical protein
MEKNKQFKRFLIVCGLLSIGALFVYHLGHPLIERVTRITYSKEIYNSPLGKQCANEWKSAKDMYCVNRGNGIEIAFAASMTEDEVAQYLSETGLRRNGYFRASDLNERYSYIVGIDVPTGEELCWERELPKHFREIESAWTGCNMDRELECCIDWGY